MYNRRYSADPRERAKQEGGIIRERMVKLASEEKATPVQEEGPIKVYQSPRTNGGPISKLGPRFTFYDLLVSEESELVQLRDYSFETWVFPEVRYVTSSEGVRSPIIIPIKHVGSGVDRMEGSPTQVGPRSITQYAWIPLNLSKSPIQTFGSHPGVPISRMQYLVCVNVGDPRTGRLDNSYIEYALALNTPVIECTHMTSKEYDSRAGEAYYYYEIKGNEGLEKEIFDQWFNTTKHYFNGVLYPKIRSYMAE